MTGGPATAALAGTLVLCLGGAIGLQIARGRVYAAEQQITERILYVRSGAAIERLTLDFDALAADIYWVRAIQHYGGDRRQASATERKYQLLYPLLDHSTTLDPYFTIAYRFGAIFLSEAYPGGAGRPDLAIALLQKGLSVQPEKWQYFHDIAFVHYWHYRDLRAAADWFRKAAACPGAPNWLAPLVANMLAADSDRASSRVLWSQILQSEEEWLRRTAARALQQLDARDIIDQLQAVAQRFPPAAGQPYSWESLVRRRVLRGIPADPTGTPFEIDPDTGAVTLSRQSSLFPLPENLFK